MCGLAGLYSDREGLWPGSVPVDETLARMAKAVEHRGPDHVGFHISPQVGLAHRRLSILDLTEAGNQPMLLAEAGLALVFNGECYNFHDLRRELEGKGVRFRTRTDTEVVLQAYAQWGVAGLKKLEGIFAFALWDDRNKRLILMRDRLGVKPLYYSILEGGLAFGSEPAAVHAVLPGSHSLDEQAFSEYLWFGNVLGDRTFSTSVRQLSPGQWLIADRGGIQVEPWFRIEEWLAGATPEDNDALLRRTRESLDKAVKRQLVADVPVGLFLSGGIDSSSIAAAAAASGQSVIAYSAAFDFAADGDEIPKAATVASALGLEHRVVKVGGTRLMPVLRTLARRHHDPFADAANVALYLLCDALEGQVKVVLQGDGGDEVFAGYRRYQLLRHVARFRAVPSFVLAGLRRAGWPGGKRLARLASALAQPDAATRMAYLLTLETPDAPPESLLTPERRNELMGRTDPLLEFREAAHRFSAFDPVQQMLLCDLTIELPCTFLPKVDRATMAKGIEARVPLLDERVCEWAVGTSAEIKLRGGGSKWLLRESQRARLPADILDGPKVGFGVPYARWIDSTLKQDTWDRLTDPSFLNRYGFSVAPMEALLRGPKAEARRGFTLWKLLQLAIRDEVLG